MGKESAGDSRTEYILSIKVIATQSVPANFTMAPITQGAASLTAGALSGDATAQLQWQRSNSANGVYQNIDGEDGTTYTLAGDAGKYIRVVATGTGSSVGKAISAPVYIPQE